MTNEEAIKELKIEFVGEYDRQREAKNIAIKALGQVEKLRELKKITEEKERFYAKEPYDHTLYSNGLADAYCTVNALIDEILEVK